MSSNRLEHAKWLLERHFIWINSVEVKVGVLAAANGAMLSTLVSAAAKATMPTAWVLVFGLLAMLCAGLAIVSALMTLKPRSEGPNNSLFYFKKICELDRDIFKQKFAKVSDEQLLEDCTTQIHRLAEIAEIKYSWSRKSLFWTFIAIFPWLLAIAGFSHS